MGLDAIKPDFGACEQQKAHSCLRIHAVWLAPLLFDCLKVYYLNLLNAKFHF